MLLQPVGLVRLDVFKNPSDGYVFSQCGSSWTNSSTVHQCSLVKNYSICWWLVERKCRPTDAGWRFFDFVEEKVTKIEWLTFPSPLLYFFVLPVTIVPPDPVYLHNGKFWRCGNSGVKRCWTFCNRILPLLQCGFHTTEQYFTWGLTIDLYRFVKVAGFLYLLNRSVDQA